MFNLSKIINQILGINKKASFESELQKERDRQGLASAEDVGEKALGIDRKDQDLSLIEKNLEGNRSSESDPKITEAAVDDHSGFTARQPDKTDDYGDVSPIAVASEAWDSRARELYKKELAKIGNSESILDKYIGDRSNIELKKNPISMADSGIANNPERFSDYGSTPFEDAKKNMEITDKKTKISKISSQIMDLDAIRLAVEVDAIKRGHHTDNDKKILSSVRNSKKALLQELLGV
jgi:hypothetical protein